MKHFRHCNRVGASQGGGIMVMSAMTISLLSVLALGMVSLQTSGAIEQRNSQQEVRATLAAEAGLGEAYMALENGRSGNLGTAGQPVAMCEGEVFVTTQVFGPTKKLMRVTAEARVGGSEAGAELILQDNVDTLFVWGAFGDSTLELSSQAKVDSYDSTLGTYASQATSGSGANRYARAGGNIGSNGDVKLKQNAIVMGDATPGAAATITITGNALVSGSTANNTIAVDLPPIEVPSIASTGDRTFNGTSSLASGSYHIGAGVANTGAVLNITGPATIVFDSLVLKSNSSFVIDSSAGEVEIFVINDFVMNSNTQIASTDFDPRDIKINLLSDNIINPEVKVDLDDVLFESNAKLYGTIYAPDARIEIESNFELFGAVIAELIVLESNARVHYDEALSRVLAPGTRRYTRVSWRAMH
jgi:hypothetical protein